MGRPDEATHEHAGPAGTCAVARRRSWPESGRLSPVEDTDGNAERTDGTQGRGRRRRQDAHRRGVGLDRERVPRPDRGRDGRAPHRPGRGGRRLQDLQEHARAPGHRRRRVPAAVGVPERPECADLRPGRHQRRGQGAAGLLPDQPAAGDQGRVWPTGRCSRRRTWPRWPTCRPARCCWPAWPAPWPPRCSRWPGCSRRCRATWPTGSRRSSSSARPPARRCRPRPAEARRPRPRRRGRAQSRGRRAERRRGRCPPRRPPAAEPVEAAGEAEAGAEAADTPEEASE